MFTQDFLRLIDKQPKVSIFKKISFNSINPEIRNEFRRKINLKKQRIFQLYQKSSFIRIIIGIYKIKSVLFRRNNSLIKRYPYSIQRKLIQESKYFKSKILGGCCGSSMFQNEKLHNFKLIKQKLQKFNKKLTKQLLFQQSKSEIYENIEASYCRSIYFAIYENHLQYVSNCSILGILCQKKSGKSMLVKIYDSYLIENENFNHFLSQKKDQFPVISKQNLVDSSNTSIKSQNFLINIILSQCFYISLKIHNQNNAMVTMIKKDSASKVQISEKSTKEKQELLKKQKKRTLSQLQMKKQIKLYVESILSQNKDQLLGGGGCCSKSQINENNFNTINIIDETLNNNHQNKEFEKEHKKWTQYEIVSQSIEKDTQLKVQKLLLKQCIVDQIINSEDQINTYQQEIQDVFETYLILEITRVSNKTGVKQEEFENILHKVQSIKSYEQDFPIMELVFYAEMLTNLNRVNHEFDESEQNVIIQIKALVNSVLKYNKNQDFSTIISSANAIKNIHIFNKKKELFPLLFQIEILVRKIEQFGDKFVMVLEEEEILFYVRYFFEINEEQNKQDQMILTLIKVNYILEKFLKQKSQQNNKTQTYKQFSNVLINANIDIFLNELMQKSDNFNNKYFLIFSIQNLDYRYITLSILLNINSIFTIAFQNTQNQEYLIEFLCNKYLTEQELTIRVIFEKSKEFVEQFNQNIKTEGFKQKMIAFDKQRKQKLQPHFASLKNHERSISSFDDIIKLISDNAIQKWERDIKKRQRSNIAQKDDILLEVRDLYINQMITYLNGNPIFQKSKQNNGVENEHSIDQQNALQDILKLFLIHDYSYRLKCINSKSGENVDDANQFKNQSNQCQILGILAEGGTGKSMFMKKIETSLIEKLTKLNNETETGNYLPILVKCNSLNSKNPSLEEYLKQQGINEDMVQSLKQNERNKLILLDGYDEYTGDYFMVYSTLKIKEWKNTKVIIATRKEKLSEKDACQYFSKQNELGKIDEMSYTLVKLEEFTSKDIHEYADRYFKQERKTDQIYLIEKDLKNLRDCLTNIELEKLLHLPINLYLFTRMLINLDNKEIQNLKNKVSDQIGIQEIFFSDQFEREAQSFIDAHIDSVNLKRDRKFRTSIQNCYFEYFQTVAMLMFKNKGVIKSNYLQLQKQNINFNISQSVTQNLQQLNVVSLLDKIQNYINSKIITRVKSEQQQKIYQSAEKQQQFIEFKHKSLYEYFVARAMKSDFDTHGENIYKLKIEELNQFKINQKSIMNGGSNQSEQQILIKLYKLIKNQIESQEFYLNYHENLIEKNNRYIQYLSRSQIQTNTDISKIDIGASNLISTLFLSKFSYSKLNLRLCSLSKAYISTPKSIEINFDRCNFQDAFLQNSKINFDSCNTQSASFDAFSKAFDTDYIYSFNKVLWGKNNLLYSISQSGQLNEFKISYQGFQLFKSKQLSQSFLNDIQFANENHFLVSSKYTLFLININSFEIQQTQKFTQPISKMTVIEENIIVFLENQTIFKGTFRDGFQQLGSFGRVRGSAYNQVNQILVTYQNESFSLWNIKQNFELINTIQGHTGDINSIAFSVDGKYLTTVSRDKTCKIWNAEKGFELINTIQGLTDSIISVDFSTDGKYLATGSRDAICQIWNAEKNFELINTIQKHTGEISSVAFSEDGKYLATGSSDTTCKIWNAEKGFELINTIQGHTNDINSIVFSADGKYLATGSSDTTCKIWNAEKGFELSNTIQGHTKEINSIAFSPDGKYLATGSWDTTCKIWNVQKGFEFINTIQGHTKEIMSVAFSADGKYLSTGSSDTTCKIWNAEQDFELIKTIQGHIRDIKSIAFSSDGKFLATSSLDTTCKIWNAEKDYELINSIQIDSDCIISINFSADGKYLATGSREYICKIWNVQKGFELINTIEGHSGGIISVAFSVDGKYLTTGSSDYTCKIWNTEKRFELINTIQGHTNQIKSVAFSADGKYLATSSNDQTYKIWNTEKGFELINAIQGHTDWIYFVTFSADGKYLATGSSDTTCKIWNAAQGFELINTIQGHSKRIISVAFSADGKYLASGSWDTTCKIWNAEQSFELINTIQGHTSKIISVAFSEDGKQFITSSNDFTCKIWNVEKSFELINTIKVQTGEILSVAFSAYGKYIAAGSRDTTCKVWNAEKGSELINTIYGHTQQINSVAFSANGKYLATGSRDTTCKVWNAEKGFELINTIQGHSREIIFVVFSADVKYLATSSRDSTCKIWNVEKDFELINSIQILTGGIFSVAFSADGKYLATGLSDTTCQIWSTEKYFKLKLLTDSLCKIQFSKDNKYIFVEQIDQNCKIYDLSTLEIMNEQGQDIYEKVKEKYQFQQISDYEKLNLFENLYVL